MADNALAWAFLAAGIAVQVIACLLLRRPLRLWRSGGMAVGRVLGNEEPMVASTGSASSLFIFPVVEFTTPQGRTISFTSEVGRRTARKEGSTVKVMFDPEHPNDASLATFTSIGMFPLITSLFGLPFVVAGCNALG